MKRLRALPRSDRLVNDVRARRRYFGQAVYFVILLALFVWLANLAFGKYLFFRAEGLVTQDKQVIAIGYVANVVELPVTEGMQVEEGAVLARVRSPQTLESVALLAARLADAKQRSSQLEARREFLQALVPIAEKRARDMTALRQRQEEGLKRGVATTTQQREFLTDEYDAIQERERIRSELSTIDAELAGLSEIMASGQGALDELKLAYGDGVIRAPKAGTVVNLDVSKGSVASSGAPLMELLVDGPYVLAYLTPGALQRVQIGNQVTMQYGVEEFTGRVTEIFPVSQRLPDEFQRTFRPTERSQILRVEITGTAPPAPTFTKVDVRMPGVVSDWLAQAWAAITG